VVAEAAADDQSDLGVYLLDACVGQGMVQRGLHFRALVGDASSEFDERLEARPPGPLQPAVEQRERVLERVGAVDLAQLLFEQVGAVDRGVELLDPGELLLLALG
jgi:hypothetical protein